MVSAEKSRPSAAVIRFSVSKCARISCGGSGEAAMAPTGCQPSPCRAVRRSAALGTALPFLGSARNAAAQQADLVARRVYFDNPDYGSVRVSPDGQALAFLAPIDGVRNLWDTPVADLAAARPVTRATDRNLAAYFRWAHTNRHLVYFREHDGDENWRASSVDIVSGATVPLSPERGVKSFLQEVDHKFPDQMLLRHNARDKRYFDLFRVNLVTGANSSTFRRFGRR